MHQISNHLLQFFNHLYVLGRHSRSRMMTDQLMCDHSMYDKQPRNLMLKTILNHFQAIEESCGVRFRLSRLLYAIKQCVIHRKELTVTFTDPDEEPRPGEIRIMTQKKAKSGKKVK